MAHVTQEGSAHVASESEAALYPFSPQVGRDDQEAFFVSLDGLGRLHPDEAKLAVSLHEAVAEVGFWASVAIADSPVSAWVVARAVRIPAVSISDSSLYRRSWVRHTGESEAFGGVTVSPNAACQVVSPGEDRAALAALPVEMLPMSDQIARLCRVLGIDRVGELAELPMGALSQRFGKEGATLEARARGRARDLFRVEIPEEIEMAELHLDQPTDDFEVMIFVHKNVLDRLVRQVAATRRSIVALEISWVLADVERSRITHVFRPARPTLDARTLLDLILLWLNSGPATDLVDAIVMRAPEVGVATPRQLRLFERREDLAEDALRLAQSRLIAAFGASAVVTPTLADTHRPEARVVWRSPSEGAALPEGAVTPEGGGDAARARSHAEMAGPWEAGGLGLMGAMPPALDLFDPPRPVIVRGSWLRVVYPGPGVRSSEPTWRRIVTRRGPYEIAGAWWREDGFSRRYEVVTLDDGSQLWIFHDRRGAFLQAYLD